MTDTDTKFQTSLVGRQHYVFGFGPNKRITISNSHLIGKSPYSTNCDGYHYWGILLGGGGDDITFQSMITLFLLMVFSKLDSSSA